MAQSRRTAPKRPLDLVGLKFIRMVMASYFIALSVDVIHGVNTSVFFAPFMSEPMAERVGSAVVLYFAALLFFGLFLRLSSLYLAIMVLTSSIVENFFYGTGGSVDAFWRDLVIVCGLLLTYCTLSPREMRRQAFIMTYVPAPVMHVAGKVYPRRIAKGGVVQPFMPFAEDTSDAQERAGLAPDMVFANGPAARQDPDGTDEDATVVDTRNIFAAE